MWFLTGTLHKTMAVTPLIGFGAMKGFEPQRWICTHGDCNGHIYDPAQSGGLAFEELPKSWRCPSCGAKKKHYKKTEKRAGH